MKAFEFSITGYEAKRNGNTLFIWELDSQGDRLNISPLEITVSDLSSLIDESEKLQRFYNPTCLEVTSARTNLETARKAKTEGVFALALQAYMDVYYRHVEAFKCEAFH